ncbi:LOW QUALITY PROTEIN: hypothetical protein BC938DRAFT_474218 [Jimgerdemannia flammicorona]|uniref:SDA1 middle domain-containing protein n=1 Tax=Jimgerdemannia flammicorona TaxID=994334 RepID=A0A433Q2Q1_9FUNG|nr:LOW QUALITY PROTEIN: hypothetical protein BC938DRAFT_474218 [Jimgerdemannia flammicorona]
MVEGEDVKMTDEERKEKEEALVATETKRKETAQKLMTSRILTPVDFAKLSKLMLQEKADELIGKKKSRVWWRKKVVIRPVIFPFSSHVPYTNVPRSPNSPQRTRSSDHARKPGNIEHLVKLHEGREGRGSNHQQGEGEEQKLCDDCAQI